MMRRKACADRTSPRRDHGRLLALVGPVTAAFVAGCSGASPLRSIIRSTSTPTFPPTVSERPRPTLAPTPPDASTTLLRDLLPEFAALPDTKSVILVRRDGGFAMTLRTEVYVLELQDDAYHGTATLTARSAGSTSQRTDSRAVTVPQAFMQDALTRILESRVSEGQYVPHRPSADRDTEVRLHAELAGKSVEIFTQSQGGENLPWAVTYQGRTLVASDGIIPLAVKRLDGYLPAGLMQQMVYGVEMDEADRRRGHPMLK